MPTSDLSDSQDSSPQDQEIKATNLWRTYRIFAGLLTIYVGYKTLVTFILASSVSQAYSFLAGVMSGLGSAGMGISIPLPGLLVFLVLLIGGLFYCGKKGKGSSVVWFAALIILPMGLWGQYLLAVVPGMSSDGSGYMALIIDLGIAIYLVWVLLKTSADKGSLRDRMVRMISMRNLGIASLITVLVIAFAYRNEIAYEYNKRYWKPSDKVAGVSLGLAHKLIDLRVKGKSYGCQGNICSWHYRSNKRPDLLIYFDDGKAVTIHTISPRVTGDKVPFQTVAQMQEILGKEDILSDSYPGKKYTYIKWNIAYEWQDDVLTGIILGIDDWSHEVQPKVTSRYYVSGRQVCPSAACPWDLEGNLKPEYQNASYRDFMAPPPELKKLLDEAEQYEKNNYEADRLKAHEIAIIKHHQPKAEKGSAFDQWRLGNMYYRNGKSQGVYDDYPKAIKWLRLAAKQDYAQAQYNLGELYEDDVAPTRDYAKALKWYQVAAENRYSKAMNRLGIMYMEGKGVAKDPVTAFKWFHLCGGCSEGYITLRNSLSQDQINQARTMAEEWREKFANR